MYITFETYQVSAHARVSTQGVGTYSGQIWYNLRHAQQLILSDEIVLDAEGKGK